MMVVICIPVKVVVMNVVVPEVVVVVAGTSST